MRRQLFNLNVSLTLIMMLVIMLTIVSAGLLLMRDAKQALLEEKQNKLFSYALMLDEMMPGTFDQILQEKGLASATREEKINALNQKLSPVTDQIAGLESGVGVGYYSKELDAIITYGPSDQLGQTVG
ncbi:MAG: two-component system sensor histidine kinase AtoS, partial [Syntrophomonadaceae bacterium]|nr:two-component system sensor histidine kinase AtoS [Syntrophomonadaceae bacterium]